MMTMEIMYDINQKPEQMWRLELGFGRESTQSVWANAILVAPITPKMGGRGNVHQRILVLTGSGFKDATDQSCKKVYAEKREKIKALT